MPLSRFVDTEKWRKETDLDNSIATWDYPEKAEISKYYKQFYHKTDNVRAKLTHTARATWAWRQQPSVAAWKAWKETNLVISRMAAPSTSRPSAALT